MKLIVKVFIFFLVFIICWTVIMAFFLPKSVLKGFRILEDARYEWEIDRVTTGINQLILKHESLLLDWIKWDDAYTYVSDGNINFVKVNITQNFFEDQELDYILFFNDDNQLLHASSYDHLQSKFREVPQSLIEKVKTYPNQSGILFIEGQPIVFTALKVTNSLAEAQPKGLFVFAYTLEQSRVVQLGDTIKEEVSILETFVPGESTYFEVETIEDEKLSTAFIKLPYLNEVGYMLIKLNLPRDILLLGEETVRNTLILFIISFLILSGFLYIWVRKIIIKIETIIKDVSYISTTKDLSKRISIQSTGELNILKDGINNMLDEISHMNKKLTDYARLDPLTGITNRRGGFEQLQVLMDEARSKNLDLSICFIDVNDLKLVNDTFGHNTGDEYLKEVCNIIEQNTRISDIFCRLGGDEFLLIFHLCNQTHAEETMQRIVTDFDLYNMKSSVPYTLSISFGIIEYDYKVSLTEYIELADQKMYAHKKTLKSDNK
ncbi:MAG: diguanylate cyclase [Clostridiales bacterium]|nr:diguanylate cyclase [Clostridiales bacterium]